MAGVVLLAFLFGPGIPILFIFALFNVIVGEMCLRYQLAYHFKKPFNYSNELNNMFIKFCSFMPVVYSGTGLWMYSNRQIFDNAVSPMDRSKGTVNHHHKISYSLTTLTPGTPFLFLLIVSTFNFICVISNVKFSKLFKKFPRCARMDEKMRELRKPDTENFYQYIEGDFQY